MVRKACLLMFEDIFVILMLSCVNCLNALTFFISFRQIFGQRGINYYPSKSIAYHIPAYIASLLVAVPLMYAGLNILASPAQDSLETIVDVYSKESNLKPMQMGDPSDDFFAVVRGRRHENDG